MNYQQAVDYLISQLPMYQRVGNAAYKEGLENTWLLDDYFQHPHAAFKTIHVGGTNGKGSVSHMLASVLQHAGYKVGLHTSPHLVDFRERIRVNGQLMDKNAVIDFTNNHHVWFEKLKPSFFEISVFMAFDYFKKENVDVAVIEVGLGGRLDSTNIINPVLSVITNIGLDHTEFLGDTLEKIAAEKAGIIKKNTPVVIGENQPETRPIFEKAAKNLMAPITFAQDRFEALYNTYLPNGGQIIRYLDNKLKQEISVGNDLAGICQKKNTAAVLTAVDELRNTFSISENSVTEGLKSVVKTTGLRGRWQVTGYNPTIICDTAHNYEGLIGVVQQIEETPHKNLHMVLGFVKEKDITKIMTLLPRHAFYYFATPSVPRGLDSKIVYNEALQNGFQAKYFENVGMAFQQAKVIAEPEDIIFIGGSNFVVGDYLSLNRVKNNK